MNDVLQYAFLDESGTVAPFSGSHFLVIALVSTGNPRALERLVRRAQKKYGASLASGEMKADGSSEAMILRMLKTIAAEPVAILAVIVNKRVIVRPPQEAEEIYREAVARVVGHAVQRWPRLEVVLDKRYTAERLRYALEKEIREGLVDIPQKMVLIRQEDSLARKELQATDYVAWAIYQKYEHGDKRFYEAIASKIIVEELIEWKTWSRRSLKKKKAAHPGS